MPSQKVEFVIGTGQTADEVIGIIDKFTAFTDSGGVARIYDAVPSLNPGAYRIQARFEGTQTYEPSRSLPTEFVVTMNIYDYDEPQSSPYALSGPRYPAGLPYGDPPMGRKTINHIPIQKFSGIQLEAGGEVVYNFDSPIASEPGNIAYVYLLINVKNAFLEMNRSPVGTVKLSFDDGSEEPVNLIIGDNIRSWWSGNNYLVLVNQIQNNSTKPAWWSPRWFEPDISPQYGQEYYYLDMMQISVPPGKNLRALTIASEDLVARRKYNVGLNLMGIQIIHRKWTWTFTTSGDKAYGGGWVTQGEFKASFTFNVASVEGVIKPGGSLKYFDQQTRTMINASPIDSLEIDGNQATIVGSCTVNGVSGYSFIAMIMNSAPDRFSLWVVDSEGNPVHAKSGDLAGGNLTVESALLSPVP